ncbi:4Fe-4S binding protein [candidate division KSB1 bacterium]|nr:4Fe-4S binding protein [candidate division KSB1 bacterium]
MAIKKQKTVVVKVERCLGCRSCELACGVAHSLSKDLNRAIENNERPGYRISVEAYGSRAVPVYCSHCEEAACLLVCPTGAISRGGKGEPVLADDRRCIGCKMCIQACPFGVISMKSSGKGVLKCDLCIERLAKGQEPACVVACPTHALVYTTEAYSSKTKRKDAAKRMAKAQEAKPKE